MKLFFKITILTIIVSLGFGYVSFVYKTRDMMALYLVNMAKNLKNEGVSFEYHLDDFKPSVIPMIIIKDVRWSFLGKERITGIELGQAKISLNPFKSKPIEIDFMGNIRLMTYENEFVMDFKKANVKMGVINFDTIDEVFLKIENAIVTKDDEKMSTIRDFSIKYNKNISDKEGCSFDFVFNKFYVKDEFIDGFYADISLNKDFKFLESLEKSVKDYQNKGGFITVKKASLGFGDMKIISDGEIAFDEKYQVSAVFSTHIFGFDAGLLDLEKRGIISKKERWMSKVVLYSLAKVDENKESFIPTEITVKNNELYVGPILFYTFKTE